jgi:hypothetical protein
MRKSEECSGTPSSREGGDQAFCGQSRHDAHNEGTGHDQRSRSYGQVLVSHVDPELFDGRYVTRPPKVPSMKQLALPLLALFALGAQAQDTDQAIRSAEDLAATVTNDLASLNAHFAGQARFKLDKRDRLVTEYLSNGVVVRTDVVYIDFLDAASCAFNPEEGTVMLQCQDPRSKCIEKQVQKSGVVSPTGRMNLPIPAGDADGAKARALLMKLVEDKQSEELTRLAETNTRERRKN